ncbi:MAG: hypothetical protein HC837_02705 [Chloroflexaceae bacterium]|nr:hypothetical protein [Chloroflexaceae bacterium]
MHIKVLEGNALEKDGHLVALALCVGDPKPDAIEPMIDDHDFTGSDRDMVLVYTHGVMMAQRLLLAGMGQRANLDTEIIRQAGARIAQKAHSLKLPQFALRVPSSEKLSPSQVIQALVEGVQLSLYRYVDLKTNLKAEDMHRVEYLELIVERDAEKLQQQVDRAQVIARGVMLARDLVNGPPNLITPTRLGHVAQDIGISTGMRVKVMGRPELESEGFGGLLAVAQGSEQPPRFICMEHGKARDDVATICLVGKGITFDTGGISIKPAAGMDEMKSDMGGPLRCLAQCKLSVS